MMNLKKILKEEATWYFLALAGLLILLYMGANVITDTYFYMISLNILIFLFSYIILKIKNKLHYYSYVVGCAFFAVWLIFYSICDLRSRSLKGYLTKQLPVLYYIPTGSGGRWTSSGFRIECKGIQQKISTSQESDSLYQIYGDSIINHIVVRFLLKEPFPDVYYIDSVGITYK
ncbi:hypothetical protein KZY63_00780 [Prevotella histicola]|uniref:hypothetical protein n=1 Tax=Prevotella histicola TaxID=470565 RepID=UPI0005C70443|nr:hypothetical protein [Prevotella histicola]MBF1425632.1 hypothetical protein [Prevotella histicola]MBW4710992.1 hypothetical protein [Prevotella histicola]MBW4875746.1 hypothetical protein [Prevotella histicola]MBW4919790.1 hypothetical protein [Prevotella histicola]